MLQDLEIKISSHCQWVGNKLVLEAYFQRSVKFSLESTAVSFPYFPSIIPSLRMHKYWIGGGLLTTMPICPSARFLFYACSGNIGVVTYSPS